MKVWVRMAWLEDAYRFEFDGVYATEALARQGAGPEDEVDWEWVKGL